MLNNLNLVGNITIKDSRRIGTYVYEGHLLRGILLLHYVVKAGKHSSHLNLQFKRKKAEFINTEM